MKIPVWVVKLTIAGFIGGIMGVCGYTINQWQYWIITISAIFAMYHYVDRWYLHHKNKTKGNNEKEKM